jgi:hypothetical protein
MNNIPYQFSLLAGASVGACFAILRVALRVFKVVLAGINLSGVYRFSVLVAEILRDDFRARLGASHGFPTHIQEDDDQNQENDDQPLHRVEEPLVFLLISPPISR